MTSKKSIKPATNREETAIQSNWRYYVLAAIVLAASLINIISNGLQWTNETRNWQFLVNLLFGILGLSLSIISMWWIHHGRIYIAGYLLAALVVANGLLAAIEFTGIGLSLQVVITLGGVIIAFEMLPLKHRSITSAVVIAAGFAAFGLSFIPTVWRIRELSPTYNYLFVLATLALFSFYILIRFYSYTLRTRLLFSVLGINMLAIVLLAVATTFLTQQIVTRNTNRKLSVAANGLANEIDKFIEFHQNELRIKAGTPILREFLQVPSEQRNQSDLESVTLELMNAWISQDLTTIDSYGLLDSNGINVLDTSAEYIGKSEASSAHYIQPFQTSQAFLSPVYFISKGKPVITFSVPIQDLRLGNIGVLRVNIDAEVLQSFAEEFNDRSGIRSFGVVLDESGILLAHGDEPSLSYQLLVGLTDGEIQKLQQENRLAAIVKWLDMPGLRSQLNSEELAFFETPLISTDPSVQGIAVVKTLTKQTWKVIFFQPVETAYAPVQVMANAIVLVTEVTALLVIALSMISARLFTEPIQALTAAARSYAQGDLNSQVIIPNRDEFGTLAATFNQVGARLRTTLTELEERIQERTRGIETSAEVGRRISTILNTSQLVREVVNQLRIAFNYHHVQIYLMDENHKMLHLVGSTGPAGEEMLQRGHQIPIGVGLVGSAAKNSSVVLAPNTIADPDWLPNPLLPETQSEVAVPILLGDELLGVLDVQQNVRYGLNAQDADLLVLVASRVATALRNAQLLEEAQIHVEREIRLNQIVEIIRQNVNMDRTLKVAAREVGRATSAQATYVRFSRDS